MIVMLTFLNVTLLCKFLPARVELRQCYQVSSEIEQKGRGAEMVNTVRTKGLKSNNAYPAQDPMTQHFSARRNGDKKMKGHCRMFAFPIADGF